LDVPGPDSERSQIETENLTPEQPTLPQLKITIYGGKKKEVEESIKQHLVHPEDAHLYNTWVNIAIMRRLAFLFKGGVESAGGIFEILCMFAILAAVLAIFAFWQIIVFFIVIAVLTLLSGGGALKYLRGTFVTAPIEKINISGLDDFTKEWLLAGQFIQVESEDDTFEIGSLTTSANTATFTFKTGIHLSLIVATLFFIVEVIHWLLTYQWLTMFGVLVLFGLEFLVGVMVMDAGVFMRYRLAKKAKV
jgi:hypothetical protein